jgi:hypothetical protein
VSHTREVIAAGTSNWERISLGCHDVPKATLPWQAYSRSDFSSKSPHLHAEVGAVLAVLLLKELGADQRAIVKALLAPAAHHSNLGPLTVTDPTSESYRAAQITLNDPSAKAFFCRVLPNLPELKQDGYTEEVAERVWTLAQTMFRSRRALIFTAARITAPFDAVANLGLYLDARDFLGRLVAMDHASAAHQARGGQMVLHPPAKVFRLRTPRTYSNTTGINRLRAFLRTETVALAPQAEVGCPVAVVGPTGTGKTDALLSLAEEIVRLKNLRRVIYSLPFTTIANQVFDLYLGSHQSSDAQIWNYQRKERNVQQQSGDVNGAWDRIEIYENRFEASYTVTTFNQILLSAGHPGRRCCVAGTEMRDGVIILDEVHKLPRHVLVHGLNLLREFAMRNNLYIIISSATMPPAEMLRLGSDIKGLPEAVVKALYEAPEVAGRRTYAPHPFRHMTVAMLKSQVDLFHKEHRNKSLLVVLNAVGKGTLPLSEAVTGQTRADLRCRATVDGREIFFLDNLVPPYLQREIIHEVSERLHEGKPVTLVSTSLIEAGVDLDFDELWDDFFSLSSLLQRGGRCGRTPSPGRKCRVLVFQLMVLVGGDLRPSRSSLLPQKTDPAVVSLGFADEDAFSINADSAWHDKFSTSGREWLESEIAADLNEILEGSSAVDYKSVAQQMYEISPIGYMGLAWPDRIVAAVDPIQQNEGQEEAVILPLAARDEYVAAVQHALSHPSRRTARELQSLRSRYLIRSTNKSAIESVTRGMVPVTQDDGRTVYSL